MMFAVATPTYVNEREQLQAKAYYFSNTTCIEEMKCGHTNRYIDSTTVKSLL